MAVGSTSNHVIKRNDLILDALWHVRALPPDGRVSLDLMRRTIRLLNNLIRQDDLKLTGENRALWALDFAGLFLVGDSHLYGVAQGLRPDAQDVVRVQLRSTDGADSDVTLISQHTYDGLDNKNEAGDVTKVWIKMGRTPQENLWYVWPVKSSPISPSRVVGNDQKSYECIQGHTSDDDTLPPGGQSSRLYWQLSRKDTTTAWASATAYVNGDMLYYSFKRPLFDFSSPYDNPDMPVGWENYLTFKLALTLSVGRDLSQKDISTISGLLKQAEIDIFPSKQSQSTDFHNKVVYF